MNDIVAILREITSPEVSDDLDLQCGEGQGLILVLVCVIVSDLGSSRFGAGELLMSECPLLLLVDLERHEFVRCVQERGGSCSTHALQTCFAALGAGRLRQVTALLPPLALKAASGTLHAYHLS